jgi:BirA family biotin operon repressor/biotin-[acetyl-CoA-carboxylase] ligase
VGVDAGEDLSAGTLARVLGDRPVRTYPALVSTHADALAWARAGGAGGAVVVADYQAAPRGRAGLPWAVRPGLGLGFSLVLRPDLPAEREGWLYAAAVCGIADTAGPAATVEWPDEVRAGVRRVAAVGVHAELGPAGVDWAVVTVLADDAQPPRGPLLARLVAAMELRGREPPATVLAAYLPRCATLGRTLRARMIPLGPGGPEITGRAVDVLADGALVLSNDKGRRIAVRPQHLARLELVSDPRSVAARPPPPRPGESPPTSLGDSRITPDR